ncbi:8509_t:CDS:2 [Acaulospora morrowiae]|uniref:8509_t:CDS:1 n=1 Tax=Acaulospora morrowiae TaxID=94023 RepID=A0A9N9A072_9GLOM|nr:8509_t:CDS:2 [Acaulospora morrowiae]
MSTIIKIVNLLAYIFLLGANVYSGFVDDKDDSPYHSGHNSFITPAPFAFSIWGVIHFLLGGFVVYQFFSSATEAVVDGISWHFLAIAVWNFFWLFSWQNGYLLFAWIFILLTSTQISFVYYTIKYKYPSQNINDTLWIHTPFSLYHSWIIVLAVISTFVTFLPDKTSHDDEPDLLTKILVIIGLLFLEATAVSYVEKFKADVAGAIVITWSLYGIAAEQTDPWIHWTALVLAIISNIHIIVPFVKKYYFGSREENTRLLG